MSDQAFKDIEVQAMDDIVAIMERLDDDVIARVLDWTVARFAPGLARQHFAWVQSIASGCDYYQDGQCWPIARPCSAVNCDYEQAAGRAKGGD